MFVDFDFWRVFDVQAHHLGLLSAKHHAEVMAGMREVMAGMREVMAGMRAVAYIRFCNRCSVCYCCIVCEQQVSDKCLTQ